MVRLASWGTMGPGWRLGVDGGGSCFPPFLREQLACPGIEAPGIEAPCSLLVIS
jgi:hypothetical protein